MRYIKLFENIDRSYWGDPKFNTEYYRVEISVGMDQIHFYNENNILAFWIDKKYTSEFIKFLESDHKKFIYIEYTIDRIDDGFNVYDHNGRRMRCFLNKESISDLIEFLETHQYMKKYNL